MSDQSISLIAGLGNPGSQYAGTRHNAGFWFLGELQKKYSFSLSSEKKYKAETGHFNFQGRTVRVVAPATFMNLSGESVAPLANFYRIPAQQILVIHDELDMPPGTVKLKKGGGHGGHNGLRDISSKMGTLDFQRMRIGIGHPGNAKMVSGYVLKKPSEDDRYSILQAIDRGIDVMDQVLSGDFAAAMLKLHTT